MSCAFPSASAFNEENTSNENELREKGRSEDETVTSEDGRRSSEAEKFGIQTALKSDQFGALAHHLSLVPNKRCLMAYVYNRAEVIRSLGWMVDRVLPQELEERLSTTENEYFKVLFGVVFVILQRLSLKNSKRD